MHEFIRPYNEAMTVHVVEGEVVVLGPDGVAVSLTVAAAEQSAKRLMDAVVHLRLNPETPFAPDETVP